MLDIEQAVAGRFPNFIKTSVAQTGYAGAEGTLAAGCGE